MFLFEKHAKAVALTLALTLVGCSDLGTDGTQDGSHDGAGITGSDAVSVTATTATISVSLGSASPESLSSTSVVVFYSDAETFDVEDAESVSSTKISKAGKCTILLEGLKWGTTYKYLAYAISDTSENPGETGEFRTADVSISLSVDGSSVTSTSATVKGTVTGISAADRGALEFGIRCSEGEDSEPVSYQATTGTGPDFQVTVEGLNNGTEYIAVPYILQNGTAVYGKELKFTTSGNYSSASGDLDLDSATDLSSKENANCYIVTEGGLYKFKAVRGCSGEPVGSTSSTDPAGTPAGCAILWESFGTDIAPECCDLIEKVCLKNGYVAFRTAGTFKEGNAVIAATDAKGNCLWSWHIWLTDSPSENKYSNKAGVMMDRNLGATSTAPGDPCSLGLLYQWGRKDPFLSASSISEDIPAKSTIAWPKPVAHNNTTGTISYSVMNPTVFIGYNLKTKDWHYSQDNTRWSSSKTKYDPCPPGYRVPDGGASGLLQKAGFAGWFSFDGNNKGILCLNSSPATWYPASGFKYFDDGSIGYIGVDGYYWSVTPSRTDAYYTYFNYGGYVDPAFSNYRSFGFAVRCQKI